MLLKSADDKSKRLALLQDLQSSPLLDNFQRQWLRSELNRQKKGIQGERDAAFYLNGHFKDDPNRLLLHDLRFEVDGEVAQIDHLVINRSGSFYLIETKNYAGDLIINDHGEFTVVYDDERFGIPSPLEQSRRHARILKKLLKSLDIGGRMQMDPDFVHVVMLHPKAVIKRPSSKAFDTTTIIKEDQFPSWHTQRTETIGAAAMLKTLVNLRSVDSLTAWADKLVEQHRPADLMALPDFMKPQGKTQGSPAAATPRAAPPAAVVPIATPDPSITPEKKLICSHCAAKISFAEGKFCWGNAARFGGRQYCREHQGLFSAR